LTLKVNPPALLVIARWRSPVTVLITSTVRPSIALVPSGPRTVPLMVPSAVGGLDPRSTIGVPGRHAAALNNTERLASSPHTAAWCAQWQ
jgi:hypothetical protein